MQAYGYPYLSADAVAYEMQPDAPEAAAAAAGREFLIRMKKQIDDGGPFIVESTLSGRSMTSWYRRAKEKGYQCRTSMVFVDSPDRSVGRVAARVKRGGHHVPEPDVRRRFERSLQNFWNLYRPVSDSWELFYNGRRTHKMVAYNRDGALQIVREEQFDQFFRLAGITR